MTWLARGARDPRFAHVYVLSLAFAALSFAGCAGTDTGATPEDTEDTVEDTFDPSTTTGGDDVVVPDVCAGADCLECAAHESVCDDACVDTATDPAHCGGCGVACGSGESCEAGACVTECATGTVACGGACVDVESDVSHCGGCGVACGSGETCFAGGCTAACAPSEARCDGACVDVTSSFANCGACGASCGDGSTCNGGACACLSGFGDCDGSAYSRTIVERRIQTRPTGRFRLGGGGIGQFEAVSASQASSTAAFLGVSGVCLCASAI